MTLILTNVSNLSVLQMSDRLTTAAGSEFDREVNKTIVLVAKNGIAVVSFCGLAFLKREHADIYLAEGLTGELPDFFGSVPNMGGVLNNRHRKIDDMLFALKVRAEKVFKNSLAAKKEAFGLSVSGWRTRNGYEEPFAYNLMKEKWKTQLNFIDKSKKENFHLNNLLITDLPKGYVLQEDLENIKKTALLPHTNIDEYFGIWEKAFTDLIRKKSYRTGLVGMDIMQVVIPAPKYKKISIRHIPVSMPHVSWAFAKNIPIAYTPWIIGNDNFYAPSVMSRGSYFQHFVNDVEIIFHTPVNQKGVTSIVNYPRRNR